MIQLWCRKQKQKLRYTIPKKCKAEINFLFIEVSPVTVMSEVCFNHGHYF